MERSVHRSARAQSERPVEIITGLSFLLRDGLLKNNAILPRFGFHPQIKVGRAFLSLVERSKREPVLSQYQSAC
jgi:hypothetical protein